MRTRELHRLVRDHKLVKYVADCARAFRDEDDRRDCMSQIWLEIGLSPDKTDPYQVARRTAWKMKKARQRRRKREVPMPSNT